MSLFGELKDNSKAAHDALKATRKAKKLMQRFCYPCQLKLINNRLALQQIQTDVVNKGMEKDLVAQSLSGTYDILCEDCKSKYDEAMKRD